MSSLYRQRASTVLKRALDGKLVERMSSQMLFQIGNRPSASESRSWQESIPDLMQVLVDADLGDIQVLLEYQLPYTSKRIDAVLVGSHPKTNQPSIVAVELKQWSEAKLGTTSHEAIAVAAYQNREVLHPITQVRQYCEYLQDFNRFFTNGETNLYGLAFLHNWLTDRNSALDVIAPNQLGTLFTAGERGRLESYLKSILSPTNAAEIADDFVRSKQAPTKQLMQLAAAEIKDRSQFRLLDEQQLAYAAVLQAVENSQRSNTKTAVVITGGPGSGKSVIALALLGELSRRGVPTLHATGSKAFRNSLRRIAGARAPQVQKLFTYFNGFTQKAPNEIDVLICDEAHRIRATSANRYTKAEFRTDAPQIQELLSVARVPVFLLDSHQVVRKGELGTPEYILEQAKTMGIQTIVVDLDGQFRCAGSKLYENWVSSMLELDDITLPSWDKSNTFEIQVLDAPSELENFLRAKEELGYKARLTAGFCWPWSEPNADGTLVNDVIIGDWQRPWNIKSDRSIGDNLPGDMWAIDPNSFFQVGCVYTAQGFEYDWNGVIFGGDLVRRDGKWIADASASKDPAMRGLPQEDFERLIKNTYKVLLTRGLVGVALYSTDAETQAYFEDLLKNQLNSADLILEGSNS